MPRRPRFAVDGLVFHVINRGSRKGPLFDSSSDYAAFETILSEATRRFGVALFAYCLMPNHWHLVVSAPTTEALSRFMHWMTTTHAARWHLLRGTSGQGAVYQGRFRAMPVAADHHFLWVCRYVERNACRASLVARAEEWPWSSVWQRAHNPETPWLSPWPVPAPPTWLEWVNSPQTASELHAIRRATFRSEPFGNEAWRAMVLGTPDPITDP